MDIFAVKIVLFSWKDRKEVQINVKRGRGDGPYMKKMKMQLPICLLSNHRRPQKRFPIVAPRRDSPKSRFCVWYKKHTYYDVVLCVRRFERFAFKAANRKWDILEMKLKEALMVFNGFALNPKIGVLVQSTIPHRETIANII